MNMLIFLSNQRKIPGCGKICPKTVNKHDFCYQCSEDGSEFLFGRLSIKDKRDEPLSLQKQYSVWIICEYNI